MISIIAAIARNHVIGIKNTMPWHLPKDFAWFKSCTTGKPIIMGRKTFESLGRPLPKRLNIVISRNPPQDHVDDNVVWATSLYDALDHAKTCAPEWGDEIMIVGGGEIYAQSLPLADRLYLTEIDCAPKGGDAFFPDIDKNMWQSTLLQTHPEETAKENGAEIIRPAFKIVQYDRN